VKVLIGIGDSWTQGVGVLPDTQKRHLNYQNDTFQLKNKIEENSKSWVSKLADKLELTGINLGICGQGNRAAVKNLYINNIEWDKIESGYLIFLLSERSRFDVVSEKCIPRTFNTFNVPPCFGEDVMIKNMSIYSEIVACQETLLSILEAQTFAKAQNLKFYFGYSFDNLIDIKDRFELSKKINWNNCFTPTDNFFNILADYQNTPKEYQYYYNLDKSTEYISYCCHPTDKGYTFISEYIYNFLKIN